MRTQFLMLILAGIFSVLLFGCTENPNPVDVNQQTGLDEQSGKQEIDLSELSPEAKALFERLNRWGVEEIDVFECPDRYPGRITSGETNGWIAVHKDELKELGFLVE